MVREINRIEKWLGTSSDTKPTTDYVGSTFHEVNTGKMWVWDGGAWVEDMRIFYAVKAACREA